MSQHQPLRFGLPFLLETASVQEAVALCHQAGLSFVELNTNFPPCSLDALAQLPLKDLAAQAGIFFTLHLDDHFNPFDINPLVREAHVRSMLQALAISREQRLPLINMHIPQGTVVTLPDGPRYIFAEYKQDFLANVKQFRDQSQQAAAGSQVRISIENTNGWAPHQVEAVQLLLEAPAFGLCLDIGHDHAAGNQDLPFFLAHKDRLLHMHAHDGWERTNHQPLGSGQIDLAQRLQLAQAQGARVVVETKTAAALMQSVAYLREQGWL